MTGMGRSMKAGGGSTGLDVSKSDRECWCCASLGGCQCIYTMGMGREMEPASSFVQGGEESSSEICPSGTSSEMNKLHSFSVTSGVFQTVAFVLYLRGYLLYCLFKGEDSASS